MARMMRSPTDFEGNSKAVFGGKPAGISAVQTVLAAA